MPKETPKENPEKISVKIGEEEREFSPEDIAAMAERLQSSSEVVESAQVVLKAAERYETDPATYVTQAEGAFAAMAKLIEAGVIDNKGNVIEKPGPVAPKPDPKAPYSPDVKLKPDADPKDFGDKVAQVIAKAIEPVLKEVDQVKDDVGRMYRLNLEGKLTKMHPNLDSEDVDRVFSIALGDQKKSLWDHAKDYSEGKTKRMSELRATHAKEFGINLDEFDKRNQLKEQSAEGGPVVFAQGKKLSFSKRDRGKSGDTATVTPREAMQSFFTNQNQGG